MKHLWTLLFVLLAGLGIAQAQTPAQGEVFMKISVENRGDVTVKLHMDKAPRACAHIIRLVEQGFYNNQRVFRVEKKPRPFLVQMGDPLTKTKPIDDPSIGTGNSGAAIPYENSGLTHEEGAVGLSALPRNPNSGDCQFHFILGPAKFLDGQHTVFGTVVGGKAVLRSIERGDQIASVTILRG